MSQQAAGSAVEALVRSLARSTRASRRAWSRSPATTRACCGSTSGTGLALSTDTVGTKMVVAERLGRYDTIGIDCVAMNVNDVICVGAEPIALLDFILTERADPEVCGQLGVGLARGAELAGIEIPGGRDRPGRRHRLGARAGRHLRRAGRPRRDRHRRRGRARATR